MTLEQIAAEVQRIAAGISESRNDSEKARTKARLEQLQLDIEIAARRERETVTR